MGKRLFWLTFITSFICLFAMTLVIGICIFLSCLGVGVDVIPSLALASIITLLFLFIDSS